jgi:hypothetical protein
MNRFLKVSPKHGIEIAISSLMGEVVPFCRRNSVPSRYHRNEILDLDILPPYLRGSLLYTYQLDSHGCLRVLVHYCIFRHCLRMQPCSGYVEL